MERLLRGFQENPILMIFVLLCIGGLLMSIGPMLKGRKIGKVACNKCGHVGSLKQTMTNKLVCSNCGSDDWKRA